MIWAKTVSWLFLGILFTETSPADSVEDGGRNTEVDCNPPYRAVGANCLLVDNAIAGDWHKMREYCQAIGGDLVQWKDANTLYDISEYIKRYGLDDVDYWVGANDQEEEGKWVWANDGTEVRRGTPLWGHYLTVQEPNGGTDQNCALLNRKECYYMHDSKCSDMHGVICQSGATTQNVTPSHNSMDNKNLVECPSPFEAVGSACFFVHEATNMTWEAGKDLCQDMDGHMAKLEDANLFGALFDHLTALEHEERLWIGGTDEAAEETWLWHDETTVKKGTPFWNVPREHWQDPQDDFESNCMIIDPMNVYYFSDEECTIRAGVVCQIDI